MWFCRIIRIESVWCLQQSEGDTSPDACEVARALGVPAALRSAVWRVAQVSGQTPALRLGVPDHAVGEGAARAGGAGVHLACGCETGKAIVSFDYGSL